MAVGLEDSLPDGGVGMNKEMLKQADEWLKSMLEIASVQKEADMIEHMKERIKVQKWLMEQVEQNKRYRELLTSRSMKQLIRLEDKGCYLPDEDREGFLKLKYAVEALEGETDGSRC